MAGEGSGKTFGTFELRELLGRGESGAVYHAFDHDAGRVVAIKILPAEFLEEPDFLANFERDVSRIKRLDHPAILPLLDCGLLEDRPCLVTPLMTDGSLADKLAGGPLSLTETVHVFTPVAEALTYARSQGIVHGSLKPDNILFDGDKICVADFGLPAVMAAAAARAGREVPGSPGYASPEQIRGERVDGRSDVYALGVMVYEALAGRPPFQAETAEGLLFLHATESPPPLDGLRPDLPPPVSAVVMRALAKRPSDRYPGAAMLLQSLASTAGIEPAGAPMTPPQKLTTSKKQSNWKVWLGLGAAAVFVLMCVCPVLTTLVGPVSRISTPTRTAARTPTRPSARAYFDRGYQQYKARNYALAIDYFSRAIELKPEYQDSYYYRGRAYGGLKDYEKAIADYSKAIELEPGDSRVFNSRGIVYSDVGDFEQAIADYNQAIELDPDHASAHNNLAWTLAYHLDTGYERALQHAQRSVELDPDSYNHDTLALVFYKLEQFEKALEHYDIALELDPEQAASCKGRGDVYLAMGNEEAALADYEMYLSLATEGPEREAVEEIVQSLRAREEG